MKKILFSIILFYASLQSIYAAGVTQYVGTKINNVILNSFEINLLNNHIFLYGSGSYTAKWPSGWYGGVTSESLSVAFRVNSTQQQIDSVCFQARTYLTSNGAYYKIDTTCVPWHITGDGSINNSGYSKVQRTYTDTATLEAPTWKIETQMSNNGTAQSYSGIIWQSSGGSAADIRSTKTSSYPTWTAQRFSDTSQNRPGAPIATNPSVVAATYNSIQYKWNKVKGARYDVQLALVGNSYSGWTYASDTTFTKSGLAAGSQYKMRTIVRTFFGADTSSEILRYTAPAYPTQITAFNKSSTSISFKWNKPNTATSYVVEYWNGSAYAPLTTVTDTTFTHNGLTANTYNYYRITAKNVYGESSLATTFYATTLPQTPSTPLTSAISSQKIQLNYSAVAGASSYLIYRSLTSPQSWTLIGSTSSTQLTDSNLTPNTSYSYYIRIKGSLGDTSASSGMANQYTLISSPSLNTASALSPFAHRLAWNTVSGASFYKVEKSLDHVNFIVDTLLTNTSWIDDSTHEQTVDYKIYAYANGQYSLASSLQSINPSLLNAYTPSTFPQIKNLTSSPYLSPVYDVSEVSLKLVNELLPNAQTLDVVTKGDKGVARFVERFDLSEDTPYSLPLWYKNTFGNTTEGSSSNRSPIGNALYIGQKGEWIKIKSLVVDVAHSNQWQSDTIHLHQIAQQNGFDKKVPVDLLWQTEGTGNAAFIHESAFIQKFKIATQVGPHGQITSKSGVLAGEYNSDVSLQFVADVDYIVDSVFIDGTYMGSLNEFTFNALTQNHSVKVTFKDRPLNQYQLTFNHDANGITQPLDSITVWEKSDLNVNLIPNVGYLVDSVWIDGSFVHQNNSHLFQNITSNHQLLVHFKKQKFNVLTTTNGCGQIQALQNSVLWNDSLILISQAEALCSLDSLKVNNIKQNFKSDTLILSSIQQTQNVEAWYSPRSYSLQFEQIQNHLTLDTLETQKIILKGKDTSLLFSSDSIWHLDSILIDGQKSLENQIQLLQISQDHQIMSFFSPKQYQLQLQLNGPGLMSNVNTLNLNYFDTLTVPVTADSSVQIDSILVNHSPIPLSQVLFFDSTTHNTLIEVYSSTKKFPVIVQTLAYHTHLAHSDTTWLFWGQDSILPIKLDPHFVADSIWLNQNLVAASDFIELFNVKSEQTIVIKPISERLNVNFNLQNSSTGKWIISKAIVRYGDSLNAQFITDETAHIDSILINGSKQESLALVHFDSVTTDLNIVAYAHQVYFLDSTHHRLRIYVKTVLDTIHTAQLSLFIPVKSKLEISLFNLIDSLAPAFFKGRTWNPWIEYKDETQNTHLDSLAQGIFKLDSVEHNYMIWVKEWSPPLDLKKSPTSPSLLVKNGVLIGNLSNPSLLKMMNSQGQIFNTISINKGQVHQKLPTSSQIQYLILESGEARWILRIYP